MATRRRSRIGQGLPTVIISLWFGGVLATSVAGVEVKLQDISWYAATPGVHYSLSTVGGRA